MTFKVLATTLILAATTAAFAADSSFDRTLNVGGSPNLDVSTGWLHPSPPRV